MPKTTRTTTIFFASDLSLDSATTMKTTSRSLSVSKSDSLSFNVCIICLFVLLFTSGTGFNGLVVNLWLVSGRITNLESWLNSRLGNQGTLLKSPKNDLRWSSRLESSNLSFDHLPHLILLSKIQIWRPFYFQQASPRAPNIICPLCRSVTSSKDTWSTNPHLFPMRIDAKFDKIYDLTTFFDLDN